ncbi:uncharacterized protein LODBEIA_P57230 [Lodderomyces beijingensis]|uniref:Cyclin-like domain-containing protein n=1 Tax=Lodderomyces beijingensis TaxID=1775926 RepID=A0ABP0ZHS4_9ASCO
MATNNSPDAFHQQRLVQAQNKANNPFLQQLEQKCHNDSVAEYHIDVLEHLFTAEIQTLPTLGLIEQQPEIKLSMRPLLLDFLFEVGNILNLSRSTFPLAVSLIDRYCSTRIVKKQHYQLLGLTSLWISCKNLDSKFKIPTLSDLRKICVDSYTKELFIEMEKHILKSLEWVVNAPTYDAFVDSFLSLLTSGSDSQAMIIKHNIQKIKVTAYYLGELFQFYPNIYFDYSSSRIAILAIMSAISLSKLPINLMTILHFYNNVLAVSTSPQHFPRLVLVIEDFQTVFQNIKFLAIPNSLQQKYLMNCRRTNPNGTSDGNRNGALAANRAVPPKTPKVSMPLTPGPSPEERIDRKRRETLDQPSLGGNNAPGPKRMKSNDTTTSGAPHRI